MGFSDLTTTREVKPLKRRRLMRPESLAPFSSTSPKPLASIQLPVCVSCRRSFTGAKKSQLVLCARCHEPTCTICSRTCNGCPPSVPPTPALTASPSSTPETPPLSPRRPAWTLGGQTERMKDEPSPSAVAGRRRKVRDLDRADEVAGAGGERWEGAGEVLPGCGRTVCQKCAFETPESDLTTCLDCAARYRGSD